MRKQKSWLIGCVLLAAVVVAPDVFGQILNPRIALSGGGLFPKAERTFVVNGDTFTSGFANGGNVKARLTLDLTRHFSVEGVYSFGNANLRITELTPTPVERSFGVRRQQAQFNILHFFVSGKRIVRPFLTTGIGALRFSPTDQAKAAAASAFIENPAQITSSNKLSFGFGGGLEGRFSPWLGVRFDVKDDMTTVPRFGLPQTPSASGAAFFPVNGITHNIDAAAALVFYLIPTAR
jgi:hypothetical protein